MGDPEARREYPDQGQRFAVCNKKARNLAQSIAEYLGGQVVDQRSADD
jgi:hypothetical protein